MTTVAPRTPAAAPSLHRLFAVFLRLGATAFGGPAMIAYIRDVTVEREQWLSQAAFQEGLALCQTIPGATAMQVAAYVGLRVRGMRGALASYLGFALPAFLLMLMLSALYRPAHSLPAVTAAFSGLQAIIVALIANATITFGRHTLASWRYAGVTLMAAVLFWLAVHPIIILLLAALLGLTLDIGKAGQPPAPPSPLPATTRPLLGLLFTAAAALGLLALFRADLAQLALLMAKIDLVAFGGGFASLPLLFQQIVQVRGWLDGPTFLDGIALGQLTPGPIVITATFVGYLSQGVVGAVVATVAIFFPSLVLVIGTAPHFARLHSSPLFTRAVDGILCSFVGLLCTVTVHFAMQVSWKWPHLLLALLAFIALRRKVDILWVVLVGGTAAVLLL